MPQGFPPTALTAVDTVALLTAFFLTNMDMDMDMERSPLKVCFAASGAILVGLSLLGLSLTSSLSATHFLSQKMVALLNLAIFMMSLVACLA